MNIYVASSWRNARQLSVVHMLREDGHEVYDFRNPGPSDNGFSWSSVCPEWQSWDESEFLNALTHPLAEAGFNTDLSALERSDVCVLVLPCGRSAHLEAGFAVGRGKKLMILMPRGERLEPELMYRWASWIGSELSDLCALLLAGGPDEPPR